MKINGIALGTVFFLVALSFRAQTIEYKYDQNGNNTIRRIYVCPNCPINGKEADPNASKNEQLAAHYGVSAYPNPTFNKVNVSISSLKDGQATSLEVIDALGKVLQTQKNLGSSNEVDMAPYKQGVYYIRVMIDKDLMMYKIMKME